MQMVRRHLLLGAIATVRISRQAPHGTRRASNLFSQPSPAAELAVWELSMVTSPLLQQKEADRRRSCVSDARHRRSRLPGRRSLLSYGYVTYSLLFLPPLSSSLQHGKTTMCFYHPSPPPPSSLIHRRPLSTSSTAIFSKSSRTSNDPSIDNNKDQDESIQSTTRTTVTTFKSVYANARSHIVAQNPEPEDRQPIEETLDWLEHVVIGLNLCPFASLPYASTGSSASSGAAINAADADHDTVQASSQPKSSPAVAAGDLSVSVVHGTDQTDIARQIIAESIVRRSKSGTSLVICPDLFPLNFISFLEVYNVIQDGLLPDMELENDIQIAPFHPLFEFASEVDEENDNDDGVFGEDVEDDLEGNDEDNDNDPIENYTNRSPYPTFHILREDEVSRAVKTLNGDSSKVWKRNVDLLKALDVEFKTIVDKKLPTKQDEQKKECPLRQVVMKGTLHRQREQYQRLREHVDNVLRRIRTT